MTYRGRLINITRPRLRAQPNKFNTPTQYNIIHTKTRCLHYTLRCFGYDGATIVKIL